MIFEDFIERGDVKKASADMQLAKSLVITAFEDLNFLNGLKVNEGSSRKIMASYYDVLRSILEAIASIRGYKIYSHEAFTYMLKNMDEELIAERFDRFRKIRNSINYYGKMISADETNENKKEILNIIDKLTKKYLESIKRKA